MSYAQQRAQQAKRVTLIGAILDALLGITKIIIGWSANSSALIADGIHSFSDLLTDMLVLVVFRFSSAEPDQNHPWGHGRYETVATVALGAILIALAGAMAFESTLALWQLHDLAAPGWAALLVALLSVVTKEWIFRYTLAIGKQIQSDLLIANAWHSRTDALSSIVVFFGIAAAMAGLVWLDKVAAIAVALFVGKIGWGLTWNSLKELVDTALPAERVADLTRCVKQVDGVISVHSFKSRRMGGRSLLEMHLQVDPLCSASEGHWIGDQVVVRLLQNFDDISHIIYHIDTYNDDRLPLCPVLPDRKTITQAIDQALEHCCPAAINQYQLTLYYQPSQVKLEIKLNRHDLSLDGGYLTAQLAQQSWFAALTVYQPLTCISQPEHPAAAPPATQPADH